jgi:hypothetical protein
MQQNTSETLCAVVATLPTCQAEKVCIKPYKSPAHPAVDAFTVSAQLSG